MLHLSLVSPVYRAEKILPVLVQRISDAVKPITSDFEIILVDDCSPDNSWAVIEALAKENSAIKAIKLSRNFGQHYAITAGLDHAKGEWIVVMDCDLQDRPEEIPVLYNKAQEGYDIVLARRAVRKDRFVKRLFSKWFYKALSYLTGSEQDESVANFGIYHRKVNEAIRQMRESIRYFPTMVQWVGFRSAKIEVQHDERFEGETSYNLRKLLRLATDIILAFSDKPLRILIKGGLLIASVSFVVALIYLIKWLRGDIEILGYTSLIISVWLLSGIIIATLGVVGLYIGKIFEGVKNRPIYLVEKKIND
ncbi:MAG: glycosyltransferase family 2 protein [Bacteroidetes bacterium]|nr:glycosyltransferase family 2 protein [Bacteroidota bacterium]MBU1578064.1 glycosyltransferase family 2 protein [Bacteroidota bacterium]MBU2466428.1 glycosyltransferase family 2 protein [Bacteroidota bacterium]MBU2556864.1 glycosyltransferase family 2 protein [Bacteroidota bacterium]